MQDIAAMNPGAHSRVVLIQLGDLHIGAEWVEVDPRRTLSATVDAIRRLGVAADATLVLGDLTEHGTDGEYSAARAELDRLGAPIHVAMGNRDEREAMRRHFDLTPRVGAPVHYATELGPIRLVVLDTTTAASDGGRLDRESIAWLDRELSSAQTMPTVLAMHHPPLVTGSPAWDRIALSAASRDALSQILDRHPQVRQILGAHVHRAVSSEFAGRPLLVAPSTYVQFHLDMDGTRLEPTDEPPGYVVHMIAEDASTISLVHAAAVSPADTPSAG